MRWAEALARGGDTHRPGLGAALPALLLASAPLPAAATDAHTHGVAALQIAVDGQDLAVSVAIPAHDVVGFEHAPRDDAERRAMALAVERLARPGAIVETPAAARCAPGETTFDPASSGPTRHADLLFNYHYRCAAPDALDALTVVLFAQLPGIERVRVQILGPRGAREFELAPGAERIRLR